MRNLTEPDDVVASYTAALENALLAQALAETGTLPNSATRALLAQWLMGTFNAYAHPEVAVLPLKGALLWEQDHTGHKLIWIMPSGIACPLARIYPQADGSHVALVVAGVKDGLLEAMAAAEWGVACLAA